MFPFQRPSQPFMSIFLSDKRTLQSTINALTAACVPRRPVKWGIHEPERLRHIHMCPCSIADTQWETNMLSKRGHWRSRQQERNLIHPRVSSLWPCFIWLPAITNIKPQSYSTFCPYHLALPPCFACSCLGVGVSQLSWDRGVGWNV